MIASHDAAAGWVIVGLLAVVSAASMLWIGFADELIPKPGAKRKRRREARESEHARLWRDVIR